MSSLSAAAVAQPAIPSLKEAAAAAGLGFGTDSDIRVTDGIPGYAALLARQCDLFAPTLSWSYVAGKQGAAEPVREDPNIAFARAAGMRLTGGHLLWYLRTPPWFADLDSTAARAAVEQHIAQMAGHYAGQVYSWNVVNEAIDTRQGDANGMRRTILTEKLGPNYMSEAFRSARAADPHAMLLYNDAQFEMATRAQSARRDALMRLLDRLQHDGAPIDGVGLQSHIVLDDAPFDTAIYRRFLRDIAGRGLKIVLTELDVLDRNDGPSPAARDADVAARYTALLDVALDERATKAVVIWGMSDRYTWLVGVRQANLGRPDGLPTRPLPFDDMLAPKPAFYAIWNALRRAPKRSP
jgi:endo-1,4-beta-xylanase